MVGNGWRRKTVGLSTGPTCMRSLLSPHPPTTPCASNTTLYFVLRTSRTASSFVVAFPFPFPTRGRQRDDFCTNVLFAVHLHLASLRRPFSGKLAFCSGVRGTSQHCIGSLSSLFHYSHVPTPPSLGYVGRVAFALHRSVRDTSTLPTSFLQPLPRPSLLWPLFAFAYPNRSVCICDPAVSCTG